MSILLYIHCVVMLWLLAIMTSLAQIVTVYPVAPNRTGNQLEVAVSIQPDNPDKILIGWNEFGIGSIGGFGVTVDGGDNWLVSTLENLGGDPSVGISTSNFNRLYYGHLGISVSRSGDDGLSWVSSSVSPPSFYNEDKPYMTIDERLSSGVYFYRMATGNFIQVKKLLLMR